MTFFSWQFSNCWTENRGRAIWGIYSRNSSVLPQRNPQQLVCSLCTHDIIIHRCWGNTVMKWSQPREMHSLETTWWTQLVSHLPWRHSFRKEHRWVWHCKMSTGLETGWKRKCETDFKDNVNLSVSFFLLYLQEDLALWARLTSCLLKLICFDD